MDSKTLSRSIFFSFGVLCIGIIFAWGERAQRELAEAERYTDIQAEIATRTQAAHLDLELARVDMATATGKLTPAQGIELRAELQRQYGGVK